MGMLAEGKLPLLTAFLTLTLFLTDDISLRLDISLRHTVLYNILHHVH